MTGSHRKLPRVETGHRETRKITKLKAGTHYPCSRAVNTASEHGLHGPWTRVSFWTPVLQV